VNWLAIAFLLAAVLGATLITWCAMITSKEPPPSPPRFDEHDDRLKCARLRALGAAEKVIEAAMEADGRTYYPPTRKEPS